MRDIPCSIIPAPQLLQPKRIIVVFLKDTGSSRRGAVVTSIKKHPGIAEVVGDAVLVGESGGFERNDGFYDPSVGVVQGFDVVVADLQAAGQVIVGVDGFPVAGAQHQVFHFQLLSVGGVGEFHFAVVSL